MYAAFQSTPQGDVVFGVGRSPSAALADAAQWAEGGAVGLTVATCTSTAAQRIRSGESLIPANPHGAGLIIRTRDGGWHIFVRRGATR